MSRSPFAPITRSPLDLSDSFSFQPIALTLAGPDSSPLASAVMSSPSHDKVRRRTDGEQGHVDGKRPLDFPPGSDGEEPPRAHISRERSRLADENAGQQRATIVPDPLPLSPNDEGMLNPLSRGDGDGDRGVGADPSVAEIMRAFLMRVQEMSPLTLMWVACLVLGLMTGNAMILICVNFWLGQFPESGRYTVFAFSGGVFSLVFLTALGVYLAVRRPDLSFLRHALSWKLLLWIGLMDTLNSGLAIYAAPGTPEVLQALFAALVPVYAAAFTKVVLKDPRRYCNRYVLVSFSLIVLGVMMASFAYLAKDSDDSGGGEGKGSNMRHPAEKAREFLSLVPFLSRAVAPGCATSSVASSLSASSSSSGSVAPQGRSYDTILWSIIFFISVIPTVLMNGGQTLFMTRYTFEEDFIADAQRILAYEADASGGSRGSDEDAAAAAAAALASGDPNVFHPFHADDTTVKLVMLASGTTIQSILTLMLFPMDALPWFGSSASVSESWSNFKAGIDCIFHCPNNFLFCILYCMGFLLVYVSAAYLNQYSVTLCSMVTQLAAPCTAVVIVIFPVLNPSHDTTPWYVSTLSAAVLGLGTFLYVVWDEQTGTEKHLGEVRLKMSMLGLRSRGGAAQDTVRTDDQGRRVEYVLVQSREEDQ